MEKLGVFDSLAVCILGASRPYETGLLTNWADKRFRPTFERMANDTIDELIEQYRDDPKFKGRLCRLAAYEEITRTGEVKVLACIETGISFQGLTGGLGKRFKITRQVKL